MSYTDPLIKELKGYAYTLTQASTEKAEINDSSGDIVSLCDAIERIFQKGCIVHSWNTLDEIAHLMDLGRIVQKSLTYLRTVETVRTSHRVRTPTGKLRLLIRSCLVNKCLHVPVEIMVRSCSHLTWNWYDMESSILGNEILGEIFLSVLLQLSTLCFKLDLNNSRFLDITLVLPYSVLIQFVPCNSLGVSLTFVDDKALVIGVDEKSVAAEDDQIQVGDVLDELNGHVVHTNLRGRLNSIMTKGRNKPVFVRLVKSRSPNSQYIYPPIELLLRKAKIDCNQKEKPRNARADDERVLSKNLRNRNEVNYVGSVDVGVEGHVKMIECAISELLKDLPRTNFARVRIECDELGLRVVNDSTGQLLTSNSFMEISSCGQTRRHPDYFGYIAGDNICNLASKFTCHIFQSECDSDIQHILQNIGEGFHRTHFAV